MRPIKYTLITSSIIFAATISTNCLAYEKGDWIVRAGLTNVSPNDDSSNIITGGTDLGVDLSVGGNTQLGLNLAYFLSENINIEVLAATPFTHDVDFGVSDPLGTGDKLGEVTHLPPTISVNYYFFGTDSKFQAYVGAGVNYTLFFDEEFTSNNTNAGLGDLDLDSSFGLSFQLGADIPVDDKWHINTSLRWIDIDTEATFSVGAGSGQVNDIEIDPWVFSITAGYSF